MKEVQIFINGKREPVETFRCDDEMFMSHLIANKILKLNTFDLSKITIKIQDVQEAAE